jgi:hypothetical protein
MRERKKSGRSQLVTVLIVCEGYAEAAFIKHCKALWLERGAGLVVTIKNARGKGAAQVVNYALRQAANAQYDRLFALLDTDTDWTDTVKTEAEDGGLTVLAANPCIEAELLALHIESMRSKVASKLKQQFRKRFGGEAHDKKVYELHFSKELLDSACNHHGLVSAIKKALTL